MVLAFGALGGNKRRASKIFQRWHPCTRANPMTIVQTYDTLRQIGSFTGKRQKCAVLDEDVRTSILSFFYADSHASVCAVSTDAGASKSSVWRIMKISNLDPYHVQLHQKLEYRDFENRADFANWVLIKTAEDPEFLNRMLYVDRRGELFEECSDQYS